MAETRSAELWDERYQHGDLPWDTRRAEPRLTEVVESLTPPTRLAMDLGCGTGDNAMHLAKGGFDVVGVDLSSTAITTAKARAAEAGLSTIRFEAGSVLDPLPVEAGSVGLVTDRGCFHTLSVADQPTYAGRVAEAMAGGGWWVMLCGNADEPRAEGEEGPPQMTAARIVSAVESRFEVVRLEHCSFTGHDGQPTHLAWRAILRRR